MKTINLTQGKVAIVDDDDFEMVNQFKWFFNQGYATSNTLKKNGKKRTLLRMHRFILKVQFNNHENEIDHKNGNGLDNRKENLRICTVAQNQMNRGKQKNNTSGFKGVSWHKLPKKWVSMIWINNNAIYLGSFVDKIEAAKAYNEAAKKYFGEFVCLNKI